MQDSKIKNQANDAIEINMSKMMDTSKFLEMISASYNQANKSKVKPVETKLSSGGITANDIQIEFNHEKLI